MPRPWSTTTLLEGSLVMIGIAVGGVSCASAPKPPEAKPAPAVTVATPPTQEQPDLTPVPEPTQLVALLRWQNPARSIRTATGWVGLPLSARALFQALDVPQFADVAKDDAPVDAAILLDPKAADEPDRAPLAVVAFGVKSLEAARTTLAAGGPAAQVAPGVFRLGPSDGSDQTEKETADTNSACFLAAAVGAAPARIVCGPHRKDVEALLPFMTRTLPTQSFGDHDLHAEVRMPVVQSVYGPILHQVLRGAAVLLPDRIDIREPTFERTAARAASAVAEEISALVKDSSAIDLDLDLGAHALDLRLSAQFRGRDSWTTQMLASRAATQSVAPDAFWTLPKTKTFAAFASPADPSKTADVLLVVGELLDGWLHHEGIPAKDRLRLVQLLGADHMTGAGVVVAGGEGAPGEPNAKTDKVPQSGAEKAVNRTWTLVGIQEKKLTLQNIRDLVSALNQPSMKKLVSDRLLARQGFANLEIRSATPPQNLPKGAIDISISVSSALASEPTQTHGAKDKPAKQGNKGDTVKHTIHLLAEVVDDGTWIALGADPATLAGVLLARDASKGDPELARLTTDKLVAGGYFSLKMLEQPPLGESFFWAKRHGGRPFRLESAPHRGLTPITFELGISTDGPLTVSESLHVPSGAIDDLAVVLTSLMLRH